MTSAFPRRRWIGGLWMALLAGACTLDSGAPNRNTAPIAELLAPTAAQPFAGGDTLTVAVRATDAEQGTLAAAALSWWVELYHGNHSHPFHPVTTGNGGRFGIPRTGHPDADVFLRVYARAVDAGGLVDTTFVDIPPRVVSLTLASDPAGLQLTLDGQPHVTPYSEQTVAGMERVIRPVDPQEAAGSDFSFRAWRDAAAFERTEILPDTSVTFTAQFDAVGAANAAPEVALLAPAAGTSVVVNGTLTVSAEASDPDGDDFTVTFTLDDAPVLTLPSSGPRPFTGTITPTATGRRRLGVRAEDSRGKRRTAEARELIVLAADGSDVLAPTVNLTAPADGSEDLSGNLTVTANATDHVGVTEVVFALDDSVFATVAAPPYTATLPATAAFASGAHTVRVRARDAAGNWSDWSRAVVSFAGGVTLESGFSVATWVTGFSGYPTAMAFAPDGRLFVAEQGGALRVVKNGALLATPFVTVPTVADGERGLLGVAFDPDFATTQWVYVYYSSTEEGLPVHHRIVRYTANGDVAEQGSAFVLTRLPEASSSGKHNGGAMHFGADGKLYVAVGDATTPTLAQSLDNPFGKILRLNRNGTIPTDNPFYGQTTGVNRAIWALGLRNPFTFTIAPGSGRMHINDVGQGTWEEINLGRAGANFGWPQTEGPTTDPLVDAPLLAYGHVTSPTLFTGDAVIGGAFYPAAGPFGARFTGDYFFADFGRGWIYRLDAEDAWRPAAFAQLGGFITGLTVGPDGALYVLSTPNILRITR